MCLRAGAGSLITRDAVVQVMRLAEAHPRREVCGLVVRRGTGEVEAIEIPNAVAAAQAGVAFEMDAGEQLKVVRQLDEEGGVVLALFHSHVDAPAEPSPRDVTDVFSGGDPLWPGAEHLIVAVRRGRSVEVRRYRAVGGALRPIVEGEAN